MITNELLKRRHRQASITGLIAGLLLFCSLIFYQPSYYNQAADVTHMSDGPMVTANTVRIYGKDFYETACAISQTIYPATFEDDKPNAVILVREDNNLDGLLAGRITHYPIDAPILYIKKDSIPEATWKEMERLDPQGLFMDRNTKVILIGEIDNAVKERIRERGWKIRHIIGRDSFELGKNIDDYISVMNGDHSDNIIIAPVDLPDYAYIQTAWNAHKREGFFFVNRDSVPQKVAEALNNRFGKAYIYILGDKASISPQVELELSKYGHVQRIPKWTDIHSQSVGFASYRDEGKNFAWWLASSPRDFGWGITEPGHNFIFVNPEDWHSAVAASLLSHKGKPGPMLLVNKDNIPDSVREYLKLVKPYNISPQNMLFNHGWIIGSTDLISEDAQGELDELLEHENQ